MRSLYIVALFVIFSSLRLLYINTFVLGRSFRACGGGRVRNLQNLGFELKDQKFEKLKTYKFACVVSYFLIFAYAGLCGTIQHRNFIIIQGNMILRGYAGLFRRRTFSHLQKMQPCGTMRDYNDQFCTFYVSLRGATRDYARLFRMRTFSHFRKNAPLRDYAVIMTSFAQTNTQAIKQANK